MMKFSIFTPSKFIIPCSILDILFYMQTKKPHCCDPLLIVIRVSDLEISPSVFVVCHRHRPVENMSQL
jgi:hypothetical protein